MYLKSMKYVISISLYQFSIYALLNACSVMSCNWYGSKMNVFGFALKWRECRMHMQYKDYGQPLACQKSSYHPCDTQELRKIRQHGTSLNKNKQWEISLVFSYIVIKGETKGKKLWFQSTTSFRLLQLIAQSIFVRF